MKKLIGLLALLFFILSGCTSEEKMSERIKFALMDNFFSFEKAKTSKVILTDSLANHFPQSLLFVEKMENLNNPAVFMNPLPTTVRMYNNSPELFRKRFDQANVTLVNAGDYALGLLPKNVKYQNLDSILDRGEIKFSQTEHLVGIRLENFSGSLMVLLLDSLDRRKIDGKRCTIKAVNYAEQDSLLYQYVIIGTIHWINADEAAEFTVKTREDTEGAYVIRVDEDKFLENIAGASVTISLDGIDVLLGVCAYRIQIDGIEVPNKKDHEKLILVSVQPITTKDIEKLKF